MENDFVFVDEFVPGIRWDAKYATWDNFTGKPVDGYVANRIVGTWDLCAALEKAREKAASLGLAYFFGRLPSSTRGRMFFRWAAQPEDWQTKASTILILTGLRWSKKAMFAPSQAIAGGAVDLTLYDFATNRLAPMGGVLI